MTRKLILFTATPLLLALGACTSDQKEPDQKQVTSPSLSEGEPGIDDIIDVDEHPSIVNWVNLFILRTPCRRILKERCGPKPW